MISPILYLCKTAAERRDASIGFNVDHRIDAFQRFTAPLNATVRYTGIPLADGGSSTVFHDTVCPPRRVGELPMGGNV